jgi:ATP-dependent Clp protease ATP-binding subunit ClpC
MAGTSGWFLLHVRMHPSGRVVVTPVDFPGLSQEGESFEVARALVVSALERQMRSLRGSMRSAFATRVEGELERVRVSAPSRKRGGPVEVSLGLVIVRRETSAGGVLVVYAPEVPGFEIAVEDRATVTEQAAEALSRRMKQWSLDAVLASDEVGEARLDHLELPFPPVASEEDEDVEPVEAAADDLTALSASGRGGRIDRRDELVERVLAALAAEGRSSVLLVGERDVGKTALVHEVAARLAEGAVPPALAGRKLLRISANELIAGARYTGMWQARARALVAYARATGAVIAMGDPLGVIDAGRWSGSDNNLARALRTYVEDGSLRLVCETGADGLAAARRLEPAFIDAFQRIEVPEPAEEDVREILRLAAFRLGQNHGIEFESEAASAALELTRRFEPYRALPGKAVRLLEESAQSVAQSEAAKRVVVSREEVVDAFALRTGMPAALLSDRARLDLDEVRGFLEQRVLGQDEAVAAMVELMAVIKAGLHDPVKPLGCFLFVGPTGVGKTELTKALAEFLFGSKERVIRLDMGEYASGDAVPRLVGSAWQRESEGELTRRVREQPFSVVLLDEIEKASRDVFDVLLAALGEGRLTDATGRTADFRNTIVIMTSNLGAAHRSSAGLGFADSAEGEEAERTRKHFSDEAEKFFSPEFFNRIDRLLAFRPLDRETVRRIARRELGRLLLREGITRRRLLVEIDDNVVDRLLEHGFHPRYGARPLHRAIEQTVIHPLAKLIIERKPDPGQLIRLVDLDGRIGVELNEIRAPQAVARRPRAPAPSREEATLAKVAQEAADLAGRVALERDSPTTRAVEVETTRLLDTTHAPTFWDDQERARAVLSRLYQLQQTLGRLDTLRERADGLVELARQIRIRRDRSRLAEVRDAIAEIDAGLELIRLELAGASAGHGEPDATIVLTPIDGATEWAEELLAMYAAWADRTSRAASRDDQRPHALHVSGPASHQLLLGEAGLHRRDRSGQPSALVRVSIRRPDQEDARQAEDEDGLVVRVYATGRRQAVHDPRTRARHGNVEAVLQDGRIDEFILAHLRSRDRPDATTPSE